MAELVVARARMEQRKCEAYGQLVNLLGDMLEAVHAAHMDGDVLIEDCEARSADGWAAAVLERLQTACRPSECAVELL